MAKNQKTTAGIVPEDEYTVAEFAAAAKSEFGTTPDIVTAALREAGVEKTTRSAAAAIIEEFRKREV